MRLIDKDAIIRFIKENGYVYANTLEKFAEIVAEPIVYGKWESIMRREGFKGVIYPYCNICEVISLEGETNYCSCCGAYMEYSESTV
jgi:hypothetical protein